MSEIEALLGLYGAIDRAVVAGEADVPRLATLLSPYQDGAAIGWYDDRYLPWVASVKERAAARALSERRERPVEHSDREVQAERLAADEQLGHLAEALPEPPLVEERPDYLAEALEPQDDDVTTLSPRAQEVYDALNAFDKEPIEGRVAARRLLAITAAARAFPQHFGPGGSHVAVANAALMINDPDNDPNLGDIAQRARDVHARFAERFTQMADWSKVVNDAVTDHVLPQAFASQADAAPCIGRLVLRPDPGGTDPDPCTVMEASFITNKLTFDEAKVYLEPSNWVYPGSFWCRMEQDTAYPPNSWVYHETVATSCPPETALWTVSADLQFWFSHPAVNEARVEYDFAPGQPTPLSDIEIDEGSLRIVERDDHSIEVITTKRVRFAGSMDGAALSMLMCATGYSTKLQDTIFDVVTATKTKPFPVPAPKGSPMQGDTVTTPPDPSKAAASNTSSTGDSFEDIAKDAAALVESYLKDGAKMCTSSLQSIQQGTYKVEDAWADGLKMWANYVSGLSKALDLGTRAAKAAAKPPASGT